MVDDLQVAMKTAASEMLLLPTNTNIYRALEVQVQLIHIYIYIQIWIFSKIISFMLKCN